MDLWSVFHWQRSEPEVGAVERLRQGIPVHIEVKYRMVGFINAAVRLSISRDLAF